MRRTGIIMVIMILSISWISSQTNKKKDIDYYERFGTRGFYSYYCPNGIDSYPYYSLMVIYVPDKDIKYIDCDIEDGSIRYDREPGHINFDRYEKNDKDRTIKFYKKDKLHLLTIQFIERNKFTIIEVGDWIFPSDEVRKSFSDKENDERYNSGALSRFQTGEFYDYERVYTVEY